MALPRGTHTVKAARALALARRKQGVSRAKLCEMVPWLGWKTYLERGCRSNEYLVVSGERSATHYQTATPTAPG